MMRRQRVIRVTIRFIVVGTNFLIGCALSRACDLCGCFTPQVTEPQVQTTHPGFYAGASEQFTYFGTLQFEGDEVRNPTGQYLASSITQLFAGYEINERLALQLNLPVIYRDFKRPEGFNIDRDSESGIGDMSILLRTVAFKYSRGGGRSFDVSGKNPVAMEQEPDFNFSAVLLTGLKFPTGDTSRLEEEFHEINVPGAPASGIHGHDLTLGTGSFDGIFGEQNSLRYRNFFLETNLQFTLRGDGDHQYHFANDLVWGGGPGYYFVRNKETVAGLEFELSGEHKDVDRFRGKRAEDTGINSVFLGPRFVLSRGRWSAEFTAEFPAMIDNTALQAVPDYRLRSGFSFHF
ncbi:MAG TPA: hypothetical protein VH170_05330 [Chthoniobacterales bacterium]|jgi:hypothetical protein|nr:hypothetical protein [Chthoniobacterales bacterium]